MTSQVAIASENLATVLAIVGFDVGVRQEVRLEIAALVEGAAARGAFVRGLLQVEGLVNGQGAGLAETFAAVWAFEGLLFGMDVPGDGEKEEEELATIVL